VDEATAPRAGDRIVLAVDVGGSHVKARTSISPERIRFVSGRKLTAAQMVEGVLERTSAWGFDVVSVGVPALVAAGKVVHEPVNLGKGWAGFGYEAAFGKPTRVANDAAMQAIGSYEGGRMLFLGFGTGLGSTLIVDGVIEPMELGHLPYRRRTYEDFLGERGLERLGPKRWRKVVLEVVEEFRAALEPDEIVIGGGNAEKLGELPQHTRRGDNENAFVGGFRLWSEPTK
jgi:polyphosphate glucokinase